MSAAAETPDNYAARRARALREERGIGLHEALQIIQREDLKDEIARVETVEDVKRILFQLAERF